MSDIIYISIFLLNSQELPGNTKHLTTLFAPTYSPILIMIKVVNVLNAIWIMKKNKVKINLNFLKKKNKIKIYPK